MNLYLPYIRSSIDSSGRERFRKAASTFYRNAQIIFITFDVTTEETFESCLWLLEDIERYSTEDAVKVAVGLQIDKVDKRVITKETAEKFFKTMWCSLL